MTETSPNQQLSRASINARASCACGLNAGLPAAVVLPTWPTREEVCVSFPMTPDTAKAETAHGLGLGSIYDNLAMESIWRSPARSGKLGQQSELMIKSSFHCV